MARGKRYQPEQGVNLLRQIEVAIANGQTTAQACKEAEIVEQTYFRWRKEYGGLQIDRAKRLKELEQENSKLTRWAEFFIVPIHGFCDAIRVEKELCAGREFECVLGIGRSPQPQRQAGIDFQK